MDLSKVLGDVYAGDGATPAPRTATAPDWADDDRLDEAFATWTPGPTADAHALERELASEVRMDDDFAALLGHALATGDPAPADVVPQFPAAAAEPDPVAAAVYARVPEAPQPWARGDDDLCLGGRGGKAKPTRKARFSRR